MASTCMPADQHIQRDDLAKKHKSGTKGRAGLKQPVTSAWRQTLQAITIQLQLGDHVLQKQGAVFHRNKIQVWFTDGEFWEAKLSKPIKPQTAGTKMLPSSGVVHLFVEKEVSEKWTCLEDPQSSQEAPEALGEEENTTSQDDVAMEVVPVETKVRTEKEKMVEKDDTKNKIQAEDPVIHVDKEVRCDDYYSDMILTLSLYVKSINKETVHVKFDRNQVTVKFQTSDENFLKKFIGATPNMFFIWSKGVEEVDTEKCKIVISAMKMEIKLTLVSAQKGVGADYFSKKEAPQSRSDPWISFGKDKAETSKIQVASSTKFNTANTIKQLQSTQYSEVPRTRATSNRGQGDGAAALDVELGRVGLQNRLLNCYLNVVIQTLAHLPYFRDYFKDNTFKSDLNYTIKGGYLVLPFAGCVRRLWQENGQSFFPGSLLKHFVDRFQHNFPGMELQQDAHEVMCLLLDGLHEDLKREPKSTDNLPALENGPVEARGQRAWEITKARDDSKIMDIVRGLYKSIVVCMTCQKESCSFDPFTSHLLPIPQAKKVSFNPYTRHPLPIPQVRKVMHVTFLWRDPSRPPVKFALMLPKSCKLSDVKMALSTRTGVKPNRMRAFKALDGKVECSFSSDDEYISEGSGSLMVCEVLTQEDVGEKVWEIKVMQRKLPPGEFPKCSYCDRDRKPDHHLKRCLRCHRVAYCNHTCQTNHWPLHKSLCTSMDGVKGSPFIISLPKSKATYSKLVYYLKAYARYSVTVKRRQSEEKPDSGKSGEKGNAGARQGSISPQLTSHASLSNLSSSSSQSSGSLNSLDSQSSGNSTSTLTADVQQEDDAEDVDMQSGAVGGCRDSMEMDSCYSSLTSNGSLLAHCQKSGASHILQPGEFSPGSLRSDGADSGCLEMEENEKDAVPSGFYIKPCNASGVAMKEACRFQDKGDVPLDFSKSQFITMDWGRDFDVRTKELEATFEGDADITEGDADITEGDADITEVAGTPSPVTLEQCLQAFMENEYLEGSNGWHCPQCKKPQRAAKHLSLWKLPPVLIITLKRFHKQHFGNPIKDDTFVHFPVNNLDLSQVCSGEGNEDGLIYDLYAVINHYGLASRGHYYAYIRCNEDYTSGSDPKWVEFNDEAVLPMRENEVVTPNAYILMYRLRKPSAQASAQALAKAPAEALTQPVPNGFGDNKAATAAASVASAVNHRERKEAWAAWPQRNGLDDQKENMDEEITPARGVEDEEEVAHQDPVGGPAKWAQTANRFPDEEMVNLNKMKEMMELDDVDTMDENNLNNSCPSLVGAEVEVEDKTYTDMDSLD